MSEKKFLGTCSNCKEAVFQPSHMIYDSVTSSFFCSAKCMNDALEDVDYRDLMKG